MCNQHSRWPGVGDLFVGNCVNKLAKMYSHIYKSMPKNDKRKSILMEAFDWKR